MDGADAAGESGPQWSMDFSGSTPWWVSVTLSLLCPLVPAPVARVHDQSGARGERPALAVLHAWDRRRARAWAAGDVPALRDLYARGSRAGAADARLLRRYLDRGLRVRGMTEQVLAARVVEAAPGRLRLSVVDRLAAAEACGTTGCLRLPRDHASQHTLTLVRSGGRWRVAAVR